MKPLGPVVAKSSLSTLIKPVQLSGAVGAPAEFVTGFANFLTGQGDLDAVRRQIARTLTTSLEPSVAIEGVLRVACERGELAREDYEILVTDLRRITTEETPTDVRVVCDSNASAEPNSAAHVSPVADVQIHGQDLPHIGGRLDRDAIEPEIGSVLNDRYQFEELVASGPMGSVYRAADRLKQQVGAEPAVAIKMLNLEQKFGADAVARLQQEAFQVQRLSHPNIINIYDFDQTEAVDFITMEWLEGESLASLLDRNGSQPLEMPEIRRIITGVAAGLSFAHARGIVHGDVKPANIYLCRDGVVKIIDFGVVRGPVVKAETDDVAAYAVTPGYASCELLEGHEPCSQDDVYALACTIFRMVAGYRPRGRQTALQAAANERELRRPQGLTDSQWQVLRCGLALRRQDRLPDVDAFVQAFAEPTNAIKVTGWVKPALVALFVGVLGGAVARPGLEALWSGSQPSSVPRTVSTPTGAPGSIEPAIVPEQNVAGRVPAADRQPGADQAARRDPPAQVPGDDGDQPASLPLVVPDEPPSNAGVAMPVRDDSVDPDGLQPDESMAVPAQEIDGVVDAPMFDGAMERQSVAALSDPAVADPVTFSGPTGFDFERFEVGESAGFVRLVVRAPADLNTVLQVQIIVEPGAAVQGNDYMPPARDLLEFSPDNIEETVIIPLISDAISEHTEDLVVRLQSSDAGYSLENSTALIVIIDDD